MNVESTRNDLCTPESATTEDRAGTNTAIVTRVDKTFDVFYDSEGENEYTICNLYSVYSALQTRFICSAGQLSIHLGQPEQLKASSLHSDIYSCLLPAYLSLTTDLQSTVLFHCVLRGQSV